MHDLKIALVAMPWAAAARPSAAIGVLAAFLARRRPSLRLTSRFAYLDVADRVGFGLYRQIAENAYELGELLYALHVHPERRMAILEQVAARLPAEDIAQPLVFAGALADRLGAHLDALAAELAADCDVVALTTCFGQLFANLALARRLKSLRPELTVILGGSTLSGRVGPSILRHYATVDYVVQGEGEEPLAHLVDVLSGDALAVHEDRGILSRGNVERFPDGVPLWEVGSLDDLPLPSYDAFAAAAERLGVNWSLPVEGSRGCWWDRTRATGNPRKTCAFCNLNVQWGGYREKSVQRVVAEVQELGARYAQTSIFFLDNIIRRQGVTPFAAALEGLGTDLSLFYEMRANLRPLDLYRLWKAGLDTVQFGIEGLSTSYLRRIGKGTNVIQNLQAMRTRYELGIRNRANLLYGFPGATAEEVAETRAVIVEYAYAYEPLTANRFWLGTGSTVERLRATYPISNVRNRDFYRYALPPELYEGLELFDLSYDAVGEEADWTEVRVAVDWWASLQAEAQTQGERPKRYYDGESFLRIHYRRGGVAASARFGPLARDVYLYCMEIRTASEIADRFAREGAAVQDVLAEFVERRLMYVEGSRYLALAPAARPRMAQQRFERELAAGAAPPGLPITA